MNVPEEEFYKVKAAFALRHSLKVEMGAKVVHIY
jgi:hypothetical protein